MSSILSDTDAAMFEAVLTLYLACGKLSDGDLDPDEMRVIGERTRAQLPDLSPAYADAVLSQVAREFMSLSEDKAKLHKVVLAAERIAEGLDRLAQEAIVKDLISITEADGDVDAGEAEFVVAVARTFGIDVKTLAEI
jgi:tellurite resistance protein